MPIVRMKLVPIFLISLLFQRALAQTPDADFTVPTQVCAFQNFRPSNVSAGAERFEWDLCQGDLTQSATATGVRNLGGNITTGVDVVFDGTNWFGFVANQNSDEILRLDFGNDLTSTPEVVHLGNISNRINRPTDIHIVQDGGNWYGFVYGLVEPFISRIDFGTSLTNTTTSAFPITATSVLSGAGSTNGGFDIIHEGNYWYIVATANNTLKILKLASVTSIPSAGEIMSNVTNPYANGMGDIYILKVNGNFFGYVVAFENSSFQRVSFGTDLFSTPTFDDLTSVLPAGLKPYGIDGGFDDGVYQVVISTLQGDLIRIDLGLDLSQTPATGVSLGKMSALENTLKIKLLKRGTRWHAFAPSWNSTQLYRVDFGSPECGYPDILTEEEPILSFQEAGTRYITLRSFNGASWDEKHRSVIVTGSVAPPLDITYANICNTGPTLFSVNSENDITVVEWNFGDMATSADPSPSHQFLLPGDYAVNVTAYGLNGCQNLREETVSIYAQPDPGFVLPDGIVCTNNEFVFANTTATSDDLSYEWFVDNVFRSGERDLVFAFSNTGAASIKLVASNPGCVAYVEKTLQDIRTGPVVGFNIHGSCEGVIEFENRSEGEIAGYLWKLDGQAFSTDAHTAKPLTEGSFSITLIADGVNGCASITSKDLVVNPVPEVAFDVSSTLICEGTVLTFLDETQVPSGSQLVQWQWSFGDGNTSNEFDPQHAYAVSGEYEARLSVTTDLGCTGETMRLFEVRKAPSADFVNSLACVGVPVSMEPAETQATSWLWKVSDKTYQVKQPAHTFRTSGEFEVILKVTGSNGCVTTGSSMIAVPAPLMPEFLVAKNCAGVETVFTDITDTEEEEIVSREWMLGDVSATGQRVTHTWSEVGDQSVSLKVTGSSGCSYIAEGVVEILEPPVAMFAPAQYTGTPPVTIEFLNESYNATDYYWDFGDGSMAEGITAEHEYVANGEYVVTLTAVNDVGCHDTMARSIVISPPHPDITILAINAVDNPDGSIKVNVTLENEGNTILSDVLLDIDISGEVIVHELVEGPLLPGARYNLSLGHGFNRSDDLNFICVAATLEGDENESGNKICIEFRKELLFLPGYPNPATETLHLEWISKEDETIRLMLLNSLGLIVEEHSIPSTKGFNSKSMDVRDLRKGIYLLVMEGRGTRTTQQIVLSH